MIRHHRTSLSSGLLLLAGVLFFRILMPDISHGQIPQWYLDGRSPEYPSARYITGVGEGQNQEDAAGQARASVAAQIKVQVDSEITSITREMEAGDQHTFETMFSSATTSRVDESLQGMERALQAEHAGMYYALIALDRQRFLGELRSDLDRLSEEFDALLNSGQRQIRDGNIVAGISSLLDAQNLASDFYAALSTYNALADSPYGSGDVLGLSGIVPEIREALTSIRISVVSGDNQTASRGRQLSEPVVFKAVHRHTGDEMPVPNLPLYVEYQDGTEADRISTGSDGTASLYLTALPIRSEVNQVIASPRFTNIPANYRNIVQDMSVRATYRIADEERVPVAIVITDENGERLARLEQRIGSTVERLGYRIHDRAGVVLEGTLSMMDTRRVDGISGSQIVARTELNLMIKDRNSDSVIGSISAEGTGMSSRNEEDAIRASQNRININRRELSEVLGEISPDMALIDEGDVPAGDPASGVGDASPETASLQTLSIDDLTFEVRSAEMTRDNRILIDVVVTNTHHQDRQVSFSRRNSKMYDNLGYEVEWPILSIGSKRQSSGSTMGHLLISQVPVKLNLEFREVHPGAEAISLMSIVAGNTTAQLRNIPLEKQ